MTMTVDGVAIGLCQYGTEISMRDYSRKERDVFGEITIIERGYTDYITYKVTIETQQAAQVRNLLASKRASLAEYVGTTDLDATQVTGYLNNFNIVLRDFEESDLTLEVESELHEVESGD